MIDYSLLNYYDDLFNEYYDYIKHYVDFDINIEKKSPPEMTKFPTVILKEAVNTNISEGTTTNRQEFVDLVSYQVDIYTKDLIYNNTLIPSLEVQKIIKNLTYNFFFNRGFERTNSDNWENMNIVYDRLTSIFQGRLQSWNKQIV